MIRDLANHSRIEKLTNDAREFIILISPYWASSPKIENGIKNAFSNSIPAFVLYRKSTSKDPNKKTPSEEIQKWAITGKLPRLHAKIYLNENEALVTSYNLYSTSAGMNYEFGISFDRNQDLEQYLEIYDYAYNLINESTVNKRQLKKLPDVEVVKDSTKDQSLFEKYGFGGNTPVSSQESLSLMEKYGLPPNQDGSDGQSRKRRPETDYEDYDY